MNFKNLKYVNYVVFLFLVSFLYVAFFAPSGCACLSPEDRNLPVINYFGEKYYLDTMYLNHKKQNYSNLEKYYTNIYFCPNYVIQDYLLLNNLDLLTVFDRKKDKYFILYNSSLYGNKFNTLDDLTLFNSGFIYVVDRYNLYYLDKKIVSNMAFVNLEIKNNSINWKNSNNNYKIIFENNSFSDAIRY
jgi:hypothetical protein